jgi:CubicO group peptidase (beta-lactamase class C family)
MKTRAMRPANFQAVDGFVQTEYIDKGRLSGAQLAVQHNGSLHESCFGFLDRERTRPLQSNTIFRIFSMTKPITSVAFMMLVEEGRVGLSDPVARYIPAWRELRVGDKPALQEMRIVDLLSHMSGLTYGIQYRTDIDALYRKTLSMQPAGQSLDAFAAVLSGLPLEFEPGSAWNYSVSTDVLGYLIEKISGQSFPDYLKQRILGPLAMHDTDFRVAPAKRERLADCYVCRSDELLGLPGAGFEGDITVEPTFHSGGGGLMSTVADYLIFCNVILNQGRHGNTRLLAPETLQLMSMNHLPMGGDLPTATAGLFSEASYTGIGFGLGWATTVDPTLTQLGGNPGDAFWSGMANTFFWCDPNEDLIGIFMTQLLPSEIYPLQKQIRTRVYDAIKRSVS